MADSLFNAGLFVFNIGLFVLIHLAKNMFLKQSIWLRMSDEAWAQVAMWLKTGEHQTLQTVSEKDRTTLLCCFILEAASEGKLQRKSDGSCLTLTMAGLLK